MIKIIYRLFEKQFNKLVYEDNVIHGNWKDKCKMYYVDTNGYKYYLYNDFMDMPVSRNEYLQGLLTVFEMGFNSKDYKLFIAEFKSTVEKIVNEHKESGKIKEITRIMYLVNELESRAEIRLEPKVMIEMLSCVLIREDENAEIVDHKIQDMKVDQFLKEKKENQRDFFRLAGLNTYVPALELTEKDYQQYLNQSVKELEQSNKILDMLMKK